MTQDISLTLTRTIDQNYWLGRIEVKALGVTSLDLSFARNENGELTGVTDNASSGRGASFSYTDAGRLASASGAWGADIYTYDAAGNRTGKARDIGGTVTQENLVLASTSNRVNTTQDASSTTLRTLTWRAGGDLSQAAFAGGSTYAYQYSARKRLSVVQKDGTDAAWYGYDYAGHRVWRSVFGSTTVQTQYIFDEDGHLLAEHDGATGAVVREYVWLDDMPVAMIDSSSGTAQTYFIHTGQLDEPLVMTDASKTKVWDAYVEPYGQAQVFGTPSAGLDLRLPGQWEEAETGGLFQNWHREYDPSLGRYVEADPLGIDAGQNVYAYVDGDPLNDDDPEGLASCVYSIASHTLVCSPNGGGASVTLGPTDVSSGVGPCANDPSCVGENSIGPIVPGNYSMNRDDRPGHEGFWRLEPNPKIPGWKCRLGLARCGFELHPGSISLGCITVNKKKSNAMRQYQKVNRLLNKENGHNHLRVSP